MSERENTTDNRWNVKGLHDNIFDSIGWINNHVTDICYVGH